MKITVKADLCCGAQLCIQAAPDVYELDDMGYNASDGQQVPPGMEDQARKGAGSVPGKRDRAGGWLKPGVWKFAHRLNQTRHAELVSASIGPHSRSQQERRSGAVSLPYKASARNEKWTLKQVQGDDMG